MQQNTITPTIGRVLHVFAPELWNGPRAGIVVGVPAASADAESGVIQAVVDVDVRLNGNDELDQRAIEVFGQRAQGSTLRLSLFAPSSEEERNAWSAPADENIGLAWAEWMPYQQGQAAKTEQAENELFEIVQKLGSAVDSQGAYVRQLARDLDAIAGRVASSTVPPPVSTPADIAGAIGNAPTTASRAEEPRNSLCLFVEPVSAELYAKAGGDWDALDLDGKRSVSSTIAVTMRHVADAINASGQCSVPIIVDDPFRPENNG